MYDASSATVKLSAIWNCRAAADSTIWHVYTL